MISQRDFFFLSSQKTSFENYQQSKFLKNVKTNFEKHHQTQPNFCQGILTIRTLTSLYIREYFLINHFRKFSHVFNESKGTWHAAANF